MKRSMLAFVLLAAAGSSWAAPPPGLLVHNVRNSLSVFLAGNSQFRGGLAASSESFFAGRVTDGFKFGRNGFSGLVVLLTADTALAGLGTSAETQFNNFYDTLLPLYQALDEPAMRLAELGAPLMEPLSMVVVNFTTGVARGLNGDGSRRSGASERARLLALPGLD